MQLYHQRMYLCYGCRVSDNTIVTNMPVHDKSPLNPTSEYAMSGSGRPMSAL